MYVSDAENPHLGGNIDGGDPLSICPSLWKWAVEKFKVLSVLDVGCGRGESLECFKNYGLRGFGIDGLQANVDAVRKKGLKGEVWDLTIGSYQSASKFDMVWCCELVEHIEEKFVNNILDTFLVGRIAFMTHAMPRQKGYHHVNCKDDKYWIDIMTQHGLWYLKDESIYSRSLVPSTYWSRSGLIFENKGENHG